MKAGGKKRENHKEGRAKGRRRGKEGWGGVRKEGKRTAQQSVGSKLCIKNVMVGRKWQREMEGRVCGGK